LFQANLPDFDIDDYATISELSEKEALKAMAKSDNPIAPHALGPDAHGRPKPADMIDMKGGERPYILNRDSDDIPDSIDEDGDDNNDGDTEWVLVSSFVNDT
jgi:hypothetical protein